MATQFPNLGGFTEQQRKDFYSSPGFNPSAANSALQSTGLSASTMLGDYNNLMGTNLNPVQGASWLTGMNEGQLGQWIGSSSPSQLAQNANYFGAGTGDISSLYNNYYGTNVTPEAIQSYMAGGGGSAGTTWTPTGVPYSSSSSGGNSFSGMDWSKSPVSFQYIQDQAAQLPQLAQNVGDSSYQRYAQMMREAMGNKSNFANVLNQMGGRNVMGSTMQSDALAKQAQGLAQGIGDKAYESDIQAQLAKMNIPQILAQIAGLGQVSQSTSSGSSYSADPSRPEQIIAGLIASGW
jgi:hypothetical protein